MSSHAQQKARLEVQIYMVDILDPHIGRIHVASKISSWVIIKAAVYLELPNLDFKYSACEGG